MSTWRSLSDGGCRIPHPGTKRAGDETKEYRRPVFFLDALSGLLEHYENVVLLQVGKALTSSPRSYSLKLDPALRPT